MIEPLDGDDSPQTTGQWIHDLARELFPLPRSLTGAGVRQTLAVLKREIPELVIHQVPSGTPCFDWRVPDEWTIRDAYIETPSGERICRFSDSNIHLVGYSIPVDQVMPLEELKPHLHTLPDQPDAIPYRTSYYRRYWGFCLTHRQYETLEPGDYRVVVDSDLQPGSMTYGECLIPGETDEEIFLSTYICHPSLGNNELSGPTVATALARWIARRERRRYAVRLVFIPETIGSILYLSRNLDSLKEHVVAGFNISCVGDDRAYSYLPSRRGDTLADRAALHALGHLAPDFVRYSYLDRGSDERQYCSPGVNLPVATIMRTKYGVYPEYHTSLDDLSVITPAGLYGGYQAIKAAILTLEANETLTVTVPCEPHLGPRGLRESLSGGALEHFETDVHHLLGYADGELDLLAIAEIMNRPLWELAETVARLKAEGLLARPNRAG